MYCGNADQSWQVTLPQDGFEPMETSQADGVGESGSLVVPSGP
jgi:hypothetical protein